MNTKTTLTALAAALLLAACGDSPQADDPPAQVSSSDVPASALGSTTAYSQFAASLAKTETGKPLEINGVVPPTSETADPIPVP